MENKTHQINPIEIHEKIKSGSKMLGPSPQQRLLAMEGSDSEYHEIVGKLINNIFS
ncbi:MAG: hypothetical protein ACXAD7_13795 [Candidatus Kariarchaeaceae archaeon]